MRPIDTLIIHCAATPNGDPRFNAEDIRRWHLERGWADIGYHYVLDCLGHVEKGREEGVIGAHASGYNTRSIGVCLCGTDAFTAIQWENLATLVQDLLHRYPESKVVGHGDLPNVNKICPGFNVHNWLQRGMTIPTDKLCGLVKV